MNCWNGIATDKKLLPINYVTHMWCKSWLANKCVSYPPWARFRFEFPSCKPPMNEPPFRVRVRVLVCVCGCANIHVYEWCSGFGLSGAPTCAHKATLAAPMGGNARSRAGPRPKRKSSAAVKTLLVKCPSAQWQPDGLTTHTKKWFLGGWGRCTPLPGRGWRGAPTLAGRKPR